MGISIDSVRHRYVKQIAANTADNKTVSAGGKGRHFDEILITSNSRQVEEKKMTEDLTKRVLSEVSRPTPEVKVEELKQSVAEGTYQIDIDKLAGRMLLQKGEQTDE